MLLNLKCFYSYFSKVIHFFVVLIFAILCCMSTEKLHYRASRNVTLVGAFVNIILSMAKIAIGIIGHSQALVADGLHSLSDLVSDAVVLLASYYGGQAADREHPYGHGRIQTLATIIVGLLLASVGIAIMVQAGANLLSSDNSGKPAMIVLWVAIASIVTKEGLYWYTKRVADRIDSNLLRANAWHHRSDAASSLVVLVGIIGALIGFYYLDAVAAIFVGLIILKMAYDVSWASICELVDTGVDKGTHDNLQAKILSVAGVKSVHQLRTRLMAGRVYIDVHVLVDPYLSVSEGHLISHRVARALFRAGRMIKDVVVHVDVENDEVFDSTRALPERHILLKQLHHCWQDLPGADQIKRIQMHYLAGQVQVEIRLPLQLAMQTNSVAELINQYQEAAKTIPEVSAVTLLFVEE